MSFPPYESYRDSGVKWLGAVPSHWSLGRLGRHFTERREKVSDADFAPLSVTKAGIVPQLDTAAKTDDGDNRKRVAVGDFVINSRSDRKGSSGLSSLDGSVSLINTVITPRGKISGPFCHYLLRSVAFQEEYYRYGKGIVADLWSTNFSEMRNILLAVPPLDEQQDVAAFLDRETAKINALVEAQRRLVELLKEERQAVISDAVTDGLDPTVPMKESGDEWLGELPAHWEVTRLKRVSSSFCDGPFGSGLKSEHYAEAGVRVVRLQNIRSGVFDGSDAAYIGRSYFDADLARHGVQSGDLLLAGLGDERNPVGRACVAPEEVAPAMVKADCFRFRLEPSANPYFLALQLSAGAAFAAGVMSSGSTRSRISLSVMANRVVALPKLQEQQQIAQQVAGYSERSELLIENAEAARTLLQERRTALISAAVTGKIDVRTAATTGETA